MKLTETFHFNEAKYRYKISDRISYSDQKLADEIYGKRSKRLSAKVRVGVGVAAAIPSHGGSLVAVALSGRNISVETQKLKLLEEEWANRGYERLAKRRLKDKVLPIAITAATAGLAAGLDTVFATVAPPDQLIQNSFGGNSVMDNPVMANAYYSAVERNVAAVGDRMISNAISSNPRSFRKRPSYTKYYDNNEKGEAAEGEENEKNYKWTKY